MGIAGKRGLVLVLVVAAAGSLSCSRADHTAQADVLHWGYDDHDGPDVWASLSRDWSLCDAGDAQSPIDLSGAVPSGEAHMPRSYQAGSIRIAHHEHVVDVLDNGHTIQVTYEDGSSIDLEGEHYELLQYHFHSPSEHTVDGEHFPMELHLVHRDPKGDLAVVGVWIGEGAHNHAFDAIWGSLPDQPGESVHFEHVQVDIDALLPESHARYRYEGSLTTPPCYESVQWAVMQEPIEMSRQQIESFRAIFDGNVRPTQPTNGREILLFEHPTDVY